MWFIAAALADPVPLETLGLAAAVYPLTEDAIAAGQASCTVTATLGKDGKFDVGDVSGCEEPFTSAARRHLAVAVADPRVVRAHRGAELHVVVGFVAPVITRLGANDTRLDDALSVDALEKIKDKPIFKAYGAAAGSCDVPIWVDAAGVPFALDLAACAPHLHLPIATAIAEWRYTPAFQNGAPAPGRFVATLAIE